MLSYYSSRLTTLISEALVVSKSPQAPQIYAGIGVSQSMGWLLTTRSLLVRVEAKARKPQVVVRHVLIDGGPARWLSLQLTGSHNDATARLRSYDIYRTVVLEFRSVYDDSCV